MPRATYASVWNADTALYEYVCSECDVTFREVWGWEDYTWESHIFSCNRCGYSFCNDEDHGGHEQHCGHILCCECDDYGCTCTAGRGIHDYGYKPSPEFFGNGPFHIGLELEIGTDRENANPIYEWAASHGSPGLFYCKEDSSVDGFEIVTHPMTPDYFHAFNWRGFFDMLNREYPLPYGGDEESSEHGLHVHVSRKAFNGKRSALAMWNYMLNRNSEHVTRVARRDNDQWAAFVHNPVTMCLPEMSRDISDRWNEIYTALSHTHPHHTARREAIRRTRLLHQFRQDVWPERYQCVNLLNRATVEVRAFGSTRDWKEFVASVDLVLSTVDYVRTMQPHSATPLSERVAWDAFSEFVAGKEEYRSSVPVLVSDSFLVPSLPIAI